MVSFWMLVGMNSNWLGRTVISYKCIDHFLSSYTVHRFQSVMKWWTSDGGHVKVNITREDHCLNWTYFVICHPKALWLAFICIVLQFYQQCSFVVRTFSVLCKNLFRFWSNCHNLSEVVISLAANFLFPCLLELRSSWIPQILNLTYHHSSQIHFSYTCVG